MGNPSEPASPATNRTGRIIPTDTGARKEAQPVRKRLSKVVTMTKTIWKPRSDILFLFWNSFFDWIVEAIALDRISILYWVGKGPTREKDEHDAHHRTKKDDKIDSFLLMVEMHKDEGHQAGLARGNQEANDCVFGVKPVFPKIQPRNRCHCNRDHSKNE